MKEGRTEYIIVFFVIIIWQQAKVMCECDSVVSDSVKLLLLFVTRGE